MADIGIYGPGDICDLLAEIDAQMAARLAAERERDEWHWAMGDYAARCEQAGITLAQATADLSAAEARAEKLRRLLDRSIRMLNEWDESMSSYKQGTSDGTTAAQIAADLAALTEGGTDNGK